MTEPDIAHAAKEILGTRVVSLISSIPAHLAFLNLRSKKFNWRENFGSRYQQCDLSRIFHLGKTKPEMNLPGQIFDEFALGKSVLPR